MDEAVETQVEQTTETESAPVETNTNEAPQESADTTVEQEKEVSKSVPYDRFHEINEAKKALEAENAYLKSLGQSQPQYQETTPELDPDSAKAVMQVANQVVEQREIATFMAKHAKELQSDPLLDAAMRVEFDKAKAQGGYIDREALLEQAKAALEARLRPAQEAAKKAGLEEGQDIARTKQQLGAVGETAKAVEVDDSQLSSAELAKKYGIPRAN